jgi:regulator of cell morphogenesis and NO signaling
MDLEQLNKLTVGEIVAKDFRTSEVFKNAGIDFCCGGKQNISEACSEHGINKEDLLVKIKDLENIPINYAEKFNEWEPDFLADYIANTHHKYVSKTLADLLFYTQKIADVHGDHHGELIEVASLFSKIHDELIPHLKNEEEVLFPAIKEVLSNNSSKAKQTIISEITRMLGEHDFAGGAMDQINVITKGYLLPDDACNTYRVAFKLLNEFEDDLHVHVHLENNILFPKVMEMAKK